MTDHAPSSHSAPIDKVSCARKYMEERNKRLRPDGNDQYIGVKGRLAHYLEDPYTPVTPRDPTTDHVTFAFIGGGFAGLVTAARLSEAGIRDVRIIEKGGDFGGTWYWNRYPGAQCDTASMVYMPLLEETGHMPSEKYAQRRKSSRTASASASNTASTTSAVPHRGHKLDWDEANRAGSSAPIAATPSPRSSSAWARGRCTCRNCRASKASSHSRAFVPHQPLGLRLHRR